ncbi:recombinase RecT [Miniphocaeibacter massiliensis]|uniref:recombinase RecT n=1 Tax=Miniphocaeibacter massiliensis TaxID=2041841 RepID=UPI000C1C5B54|nr:recombinase RecT [Miniphocaeibacter massiliensis]
MANNQVQNIQQGQVSPTKQMSALLESDKVKGMFENALNKNAGPFIASLIDLYNSDSYLQGCNAQEVMMEALKAATLNLPINKNLGYAYIVPYKNKPTFTIGYKGLIQLAMRSGQYANLNGGMIYEGMEVEEDYLTGVFRINGKPKSDKVLGYFAYLKLINGFEKALYLTKEEVETHGKKYSPAYSSKYSPWKTEFDLMGQKTVIRQLLSRYGILSTEMQNVINQDTDNEIQESINLEANREPLDFPSNVDSETGEILDGKPIEAEYEEVKEESEDGNKATKKAPF